jgi:ABC-type dipeptide/oligopeptide/nickel transport system permease subunit
MDGLGSIPYPSDEEGRLTSAQSSKSLIKATEHMERQVGARVMVGVRVRLMVGVRVMVGFRVRVRVKPIR